jgi:hypothetical protein
MTNRPYRTTADLARLRALPKNLRWTPARPAPSWRDDAPYALALVAIFVATEYAVALLGGAR